MQVKVTGTTFYRDIQSTALVNRDTNGLKEYETKRKFAEMQKQAEKVAKAYSKKSA